MAGLIMQICDIFYPTVGDIAGPLLMGIGVSGVLVIIFGAPRFLNVNVKKENDDSPIKI